MPPVNGPIPYPAEKVRGSEIMLLTLAPAHYFIAGLAPIVVLVLLQMFA